MQFFKETSLMATVFTQMKLKCVTMLHFHLKRKSKQTQSAQQSDKFQLRNHKQSMTGKQ